MASNDLDAIRDLATAAGATDLTRRRVAGETDHHPSGSEDKDRTRQQDLGHRPYPAGVRGTHRHLSHTHVNPTVSPGGVLSTGSMLYGAALSVLAAVLLVAFAGRDRRPSVLITVGVAAFVMPIWWNLILRWTTATDAFSHDLPLRPFPVSWQDTGTAVFTLAGAAIALSLGACAKDPARRAGILALWAGLGAFLIDIYAY
ncbi:MAG TPA: hypothetical protein VIJ00_03950 [Nakamurella sp.]